jgi:MoxR-like ATPase
MSSPRGTYVGRAVVVKHEDDVALSLWNMKHTATGSYPIRNAARFIPQNWHASAAMIGTVLDVSLTRQSPRVSRLNTFAVVDDTKATYGGDDAKQQARFEQTIRDAKSDTSDDDVLTEIELAAQRDREARYEDEAKAYKVARAVKRLVAALVAAAELADDEAKRLAAAPETLAAALVAVVAAMPRSALDTVLAYMNARDYRGYSLNIAMTGPSGCGKSTIAQLAAEARGLRFAAISFGNDTPPYELTGRREPNGDSFVYLTSVFVDFYENGGVLLLDEFDAGNENVLLTLNASLANGHMFCAERVGNERVVRHENFYALAALNTYGQGATRVYGGRNSLDEATLDRFAFIAVDYDTEYEATVLESYRGKIADSMLAQISDFRTAVRGVINRSSLRRVFSTRKLTNWLALVDAGESFASLATEYFAAWSVADLQAAAAAGLVKRAA